MNKPKAKGTAAETAALKAIKANGFPEAHRQVLAGSADQGDLWVCKGVIAEVKNCKTLSIPAWLRETEEERINAGAEFGFLVYKKPGIGAPNALQWAAVIRAGWLFRLIGEFPQPVPGGITWVTKPARGHAGDLDMYEVTMTLGSVLALLRAAGYGEEN